VPGAFSATRGDFSVSFTLEGADDAAILGAAKRRSSVSEGSVTYPEVFRGVDLKYDVEPGLVKETLVLDNEPAFGENSWTWLIDAPGLTLVENEFGDIEFRDQDDEVQFTIPDPYMWDSSGVEGVREPSLPL